MSTTELKGTVILATDTSTKVGIGTSTPQYTLDVNGSFKTSSISSTTYYSTTATTNMAFGSNMTSGVISYGDTLSGTPGFNGVGTDWSTGIGFVPALSTGYIQIAGGPNFTGNIFIANAAKSGTIQIGCGVTGLNGVNPGSLVQLPGRTEFTGNAKFGGKVGIGMGTTTPDYPLHIESSNNIAVGNAIWFSNTGTQFTSTPFGNGDIGAYVRKNFLCGLNIVNNSDRRIKTNIVDVDDDRALRDLRLLKPKTYTYKDTITRGTEPVYGFIAQEVKEVLNYASSLNKDTLPNIYDTATFINDTITLTFNTADLSRDASGSLFTKLKVKTKDGKDEFVNILEVIDEHTIKVDKDLTEWGGQLDASGQVVPGDKIFVYGQEVNDFHNLNKDAIWTVATAALQEVDRQLQAEKQKTNEMQTTITELQSTLALALARLDALEQKP
jgi:hypothetical protein